MKTSQKNILSIRWGRVSKHGFISTILCMLLGTLLSGVTLAQTQNNHDNAKLIDDYIKSVGYSSHIVFDASNIKQYWVSNSVISQDNLIKILLKRNESNQYESEPLKIQLVNINDSQLFRVDVISDNNNYSFEIDDSYKTVSSSTGNEFIQYKIESSSLHLEGFSDFSFFLKFISPDSDSLSIQKIVLYFSEGKSKQTLETPGYLNISKNDVPLAKEVENDNNSFIVSGRKNNIKVDKIISVSDNVFKNSVRLKNIGSQPVQVYFGFAPLTKDMKAIDYKHYPYKNLNKVLKVVSAEENSNKIIVDSYPEWAVDCHLGLNASEDLSDIPNLEILNSRISSVNKLENGQSEIIMGKPITQKIKVGSYVRIMCPAGGNVYYYTNMKAIKPGEEIVLSGTTQKDENSLVFSGKVLPKGIEYVKPLILLHSADKEECTVLISDYSVVY